MKKIAYLYKYIIYIPFLYIYISALYHSVTNSENVLQDKLFWLYALLTMILFGMFLGAVILDLYSKYVGGEVFSPIKEILDNDNKSLPVHFNGLIAYTFFGIIAGGLYLVYYFSKEKHVLYIVEVILYILFFGTIIRVLAAYFRIKGEVKTPLFAFVFTPSITFIIGMFLVKEFTVEFILHNVLMPSNIFLFVLCLLVMIVIVFFLLYSYFLLFYFIIAFLFAGKRTEKLNKHIKKIKSKDNLREMNLIKTSEYVTKNIENACFAKKIYLIVALFFSHIKAFIKDYWYSLRFFTCLLTKQILSQLISLIEVERIVINTIRFKKIILVFELLLLNIILYEFLEQGSAYTKFLSCFRQ